MGNLKVLKTSFQDRNGKLSSKRIWAAVTICNGLLIAWLMLVSKILILLDVLKADEVLEVETTLILGILGVGAGLFGTTIGERENMRPRDESPDIVIVNNRDQEDEGLGER